MKELIGIPPKYGTIKCYECGKEPTKDNEFWHGFTTLNGEDVAVPYCDKCLPDPSGCAILIEEN